MSFLDKIVKPAATPEEIAEIINPANAVAGHPVSDKPEEVGKSDSPATAPISETPLEFKPIPEEIIPPLINENPVITSAPPISEGDAPAGGDPVNAPNPGIPSPDLSPSGVEPGNPETVKRV